MSKVDQNEVAEKPQKRPKYGGRKKGAPNKNSFLFRKALDEADFNVIEELIRQYDKIPEENYQEAIRTLSNMLPYLYPALKEVEFSGLPKSDPLEKNNETSKSQLLRKISGAL